MFTMKCLPRVAAMMLLASAGLAWAQESEPPPRPRWSSLINIDAMIDNYARLLARKYNLTEEQDAFTQEFLRERAHAFLDRHRTELFDLVDRLFEVRNGAEMTPQELVEWGKRAQPLFEEARGLIIDGNNEWRSILTEEQRRLHDEDLRLMYESFATTEDQLRRMVSGQMTVEEFRHGTGRRPPSVGPAADRPAGSNAATGAVDAPATASPAAPTPSTPQQSPPAAAPPTSTPPKSSGASPAPPPSAAPKTGPAGHRAGATPSGPQAGPPRGGTPIDEKGREAALARLEELRRMKDNPSGPAPAPGVKGRTMPTGAPGADFEGQWDAYVRDFIQRYKLDEEQQQRAFEILKQCKEEARAYVHRRKSTIEDLDRRIQALSGSGDKEKVTELRKLNEKKTKLLAPVNMIFEKRLKPRLEKLPTRAQREAAEAAGKKPGAAKQGPSEPTKAAPPPVPQAPPPAPPVPPPKPEEPPPPEHPPAEPPPVEPPPGEPAE